MPRILCFDRTWVNWTMLNMCVYMCVCMNVCMYVCMYVCVCVWYVVLEGGEMCGVR